MRQTEALASVTFFVSQSFFSLNTLNTWEENLTGRDIASVILFFSTMGLFLELYHDGAVKHTNCIFFASRFIISSVFSSTCCCKSSRSRSKDFTVALISAVSKLCSAFLFSISSKTNQNKTETSNKHNTIINKRMNEGMNGRTDGRTNEVNE